MCVIYKEKYYIISRSNNEQCVTYAALRAAFLNSYIIFLREESKKYPVKNENYIGLEPVAAGTLGVLTFSLTIKRYIYISQDITWKSMLI